MVGARRPLTGAGQRCHPRWVALFPRASAPPPPAIAGQTVALLAGPCPAAEAPLLAPLLVALDRAQAKRVWVFGPAATLAWLKPLALPARLRAVENPADPALKTKLTAAGLGMDLTAEGALAPLLPEGCPCLRPDPPSPERHALLDLTRPLGLRPPPAPLQLKPARGTATDLAPAPPARPGPPAEAPVLLLPGPARPELGETEWLKIARGLQAQGAQVQLGGAPSEAPALRSLRKRLNGVALYAGKSFGRLAQQLAAARLLIAAGPQPGLTMSYLLGRPSLSLFFSPDQALRLGPPRPDRRLLTLSPPRQRGLHDPQGLFVQDILRTASLALARGDRG